MQHIHKFRQHEKLQQAKDQAQSSVCDAIVEMSVTGRVPRDLDAIFRKGADWDLGLDHILVLQVQPHLLQLCILHVAAMQTQTCKAVLLATCNYKDDDTSLHLKPCN